MKCSNQKYQRLGEEKLNNQGCLMKIIEYNSYNDVVVEFQDEYKAKIHTTYGCFKSGQIKNINLHKIQRLGEERLNNQGHLMKIIEYNSYKDIVVEFQDEYKARVNVTYNHFKDGKVDNKGYYRNQRVGEENINNQGYLMKIIEYINSTNIIVEFQDEYKTKVNTSYSSFKNGKVKNINLHKIQRLGEEKLNNQGCLMKIIEYIDSTNVVVEFQDGYKVKVNTTYQCFKNGSIKNPNAHVGEMKTNNKGYSMKIIEYKSKDDIIVEFQDKYKAKVNTTYRRFKNGEIKNPYSPCVNGIGIVGQKYNTTLNNKHTKEYETWRNMINRCTNEKIKNKYQTYEEVTCCDDWLLFENFYEWLHSQPNFDKWFDNSRWDIDKDIIEKGNKQYHPDKCSLVPQRVNLLFIKRGDSKRDLPTGVTKRSNKFAVEAQYDGKRMRLYGYDTPEEAFYVYKKYREKLIKQVAEEEFAKENITKECYNAMMKYEVEIDD